MAIGQPINCWQQASNEMAGGRRRGEIGIRKPQTSWFCKIRAVAMPITAALAKAAETTSEMHFSCMPKETSKFQVKGLAWDLLSAIDCQMLFEILLSLAMGRAT